MDYIKSDFEIEYVEKDEVLYPELAVAKADALPFGKYALLRLDFLKNYRKGTYTTLLMKGELGSHLAEVDKMAREQVKGIVEGLAKQNGCGEDLKGVNQLLWVQMMNGFKASAEEIVLNELIYS